MNKISKLKVQQAHFILREATYPPNHAQPRGAQVSPHLLTLGEVRGMTKPPPSQLCTPRETPNEPAKPFPFFVRRSQFWSQALAFARRDRNFCVSEHHRPRARRPTSSGFRCSFRRLAQCQSVPPGSSCSPEGLTNVASTENWELPCSGKPSTTTTNLLDLKIAHQNVGGNSSTFLATNLRRDTLHRESPSGQFPSPSARCAEF